MKKRYLFIIAPLLLIQGSIQAADILVLGLFKDMAILRIDGAQHKLRAGETSPEGIKLIAANSEEAVLEINNKRETFKLGSHISAKFDTPDTEKAEAKIWPVGEMYMTPGSINRQPVHFMVDTGATWVAMNANHAKRLGIDFRYLGKKAWVSTANGNVSVYVVNLDRVKVGDIELLNVKGAVLEGNSPHDILLGNSFLNRVEMQREGQMMLLRKKW